MTPSAPPPETAARAAAERAAREAYGRLVALLAWRWRDLAAAQDALGEAFAMALARWPVDGVPRSPEAWLTTVAQRELLQTARHERLAQDPTVLALLASPPEAPEPVPVPDERLALLFVCAHPALPEALHAPLMLNTVLGVDARAIAGAFLVSPAAMAQRLVRAKAKIRDAGIRFEPPQADDVGPRLDAVLEGIYGAFTIGLHGAMAPSASALSEEALYLGRLVASLRPDSAEALGLLALMLHVRARRAAHFDDAGSFVPLARQDTRRWDAALMGDAEDLLWRAARLRSPGRFQLEAAIQSAHAQRARTAATPWQGIAALYGALARYHPSIGARVGHAVALAECGDAEAAMATLDALAAPRVAAYAPYWVARAHLSRLRGKPAEADAALRRAVGLTEDPRMRAYLLTAKGSGAAP